jgi:hypothetical protein
MFFKYPEPACFGKINEPYNTVSILNILNWGGGELGAGAALP